ncbi:hypothetical protein [Brachybacterium sp. AOP3-A1-3]|uniref:hypothetical protein n=1 Tax=Brachybacterium sp. AOP3-A1-3 TaxID=3457699 RepID=UPI00403445FE
MADLKKLVNKELTKQLMKAAGIPVPAGILIDANAGDWREVELFVRSVGFPLVLKPNAGSTGRGVLTGINSHESLVAGYHYLVNELGVSNIVLEEHCDGEDFRILVIGDRAVAACKRIPANVSGDGELSVRELISRKNKSRSSNPFLSKGLIEVDYEVLQRLSEENLTLNSVPEKGRYLALRRAANASAGGDVVDVTDVLPGAIAEAAVRAVQAVPNIFIAGVDVLCAKDWDKPSPDFTVLEMNPRPQIGVNMYPTEGAGQDVPSAYLDFLFPSSSRSGIESDERVAYELALLKPSLRSGFAASVELTPFPEHRYKSRKLYTYEIRRQGAKIDKVQRDLILRTAREGQMAGYLKATEAGLQLLVCAGDSVALSKLRSVCEGILDGSISDVKEVSDWGGPVVTGFRIDAKL